MAKRIKALEMIPPRLLTEEETAHYLGMSSSDFCKKKTKLELQGLPQQSSLMGRRDRRALDNWLDREYGTVSNANKLPSKVKERMRALKDGKSENSALRR